MHGLGPNGPLNRVEAQQMGGTLTVVGPWGHEVGPAERPGPAPRGPVKPGADFAQNPLIPSFHGGVRPPAATGGRDGSSQHFAINQT